MAKQWCAITTKIVSSNPSHVEVYSMLHYVGILVLIYDLTLSNNLVMDTIVIVISI
jgi:hypothetical protein